MADSSGDSAGGLDNYGGCSDDSASFDTSWGTPWKGPRVPASGLPDQPSPCQAGAHVDTGGPRLLQQSLSAGPEPTGDKTAGVRARDEEDASQPGPCGYCCWRPTCLQKVASGRYFVLFLSLLCLAEAGLTVGYISSVVTSFELQFRFSSALTGFVVSCYDIGTLVVILTSYFGGRAAANRPKWIAWSAWVMALGSSVIALPHFFISYKTEANGTATGLCHPATAPGSAPSNVAWEAPETPCRPEDDRDIESSALVFLIPGMLLLGAGSTATLTLGATYIDDYVRKREAPIMLAVVFCTTVIGPALGFVVGSFFLKYYVDFDTKAPSDIPVSPSSPRWVGAWWLGFFFFAGAILLMAFPVYAFPSKLRRPVEEKPAAPAAAGHGGDEEIDGANVRMAFSDVSLSKIPLAIWGLLKNPVYMMVNVAGAAEFSIITGFVRFAPKFVQSQFLVKASTANLITGSLIPAGALGVIMGGFIMNRVKTNLMGSVNVLCASTILAGLSYGFIFIPGACPNFQLAGVTTSYRFNDSTWHPPDPYNVSLVSPCNAGCQCDPRTYRPVCDTRSKVAYFSPCYAGCEVNISMPSDDDRDAFDYFNCTCVEDYGGLEGPPWAGSAGLPTLPTPTPEAVSGLCASQCWKLVPFLAVLLLVVFVSSMEQMPALMTLLRCVKKEERPFALGLQFVILRLFGFIPSPTYYGAVIDSTCLLWQKECSGSDGACLQYDNAGFYYRYLGLSTLLKSLSVVMAVAVWLLVRRMQHRGAVMTRLPDSEAEAPLLEDSGVGAVTGSVESRGTDRLSDEIAAQSAVRYTDGEPKNPGVST